MRAGQYGILGNTLGTGRPGKDNPDANGLDCVTSSPVVGGASVPSGSGVPLLSSAADSLTGADGEVGRLVEAKILGLTGPSVVAAGLGVLSGELGGEVVVKI